MFCLGLSPGGARDRWFTAELRKGTELLCTLAGGLSHRRPSERVWRRDQLGLVIATEKNGLKRGVRQNPYAVSGQEGAPRGKDVR